MSSETQLVEILRRDLTIGDTIIETLAETRWKIGESSALAAERHAR
jgi:hypothetical protein